MLPGYNPLVVCLESSCTSPDVSPSGSIFPRSRLLTCCPNRYKTSVRTLGTPRTLTAETSVGKLIKQSLSHWLRNPRSLSCSLPPRAEVFCRLGARLLQRACVKVTLLLLLQSISLYCTLAPPSVPRDQAGTCAARGFRRRPRDRLVRSSASFHFIPENILLQAAHHGCLLSF